MHTRPLFPVRITRPRTTLLAVMLTTARLCALEFTTNQVFQVSSGGRLVMDLDRGSIEVTTSDHPTVAITVVREVKRGSDRTAQEIIDNHQLTFSQDGSTVLVKAKMAKNPLQSWWGPSLSVRYQVTVPKQFDLNLDTAGGSVRIPDLTGKIDVETAGGSITIGRVDGAVKADTAGGSIKVAGATGATDVNTAGGSIHLGEMGGSVYADTAGGSIHVKSAAGPVQVETSGGSIELGDMQGPVQADTSGGSISARFPKSLSGDVSLETSGGSISVSVAEDASFELDAECSGGRINSEVKVATSGKPSRFKLRGPVGQGGPKLVLRTSGGGISVKKLIATN